MANNIYVGGFPYKTTKEELAKLFSTCGTVLSAKIILDRETGRPKGFGFVEMSTDAEAKTAVEKLNGAFMGERKIFVVEGRLKKDRPAGRQPGPDTPPKPGQPGFVERRSGRDRRQRSAGPVAGPDRRDAAPPPPAAPAPAAAKPWEKKPWEKKPWGKKPFDAAAKPWEKKPYDPSSKENHKPWGKKPFDAEKKPFVRKPPVRGPKWTPKKD